MKKYMIVGAMLISGMIFAQVESKHEVAGNLVKSTYFHNNGKISQEGFYRNGKVHGQWTAYDESGNKKAIAEYTEGRKTGKWFFWDQNNLSEVDYSDSRVASVKTWKEDAIVKN